MDPSLIKSYWTQEEDKLVLDLQKKFGNKWTRIAKSLHGRSPGAIKNRYYSTLKKRLENEATLEESIKSKRAISNVKQNVDFSAVENRSPQDSADSEINKNRKRRSLRKREWEINSYVDLKRRRFSDVKNMLQQNQAQLNSLQQLAQRILNM